jgi:hypothetical protein
MFPFFADGTTPFRSHYRKLASDGEDDGVKEDVWRVVKAMEGQTAILLALYYRTVDPPNKDEEHWSHDAAGARRP